MKNTSDKFFIIICIIFLAAFSRIIPHYPNFTPLCAIALFGAKYFKNFHLAIIIPLFSLWISDFIINNFILGSYFDGIIFFYPGYFWQYGSFILISLFGRFSLKKISLFKLFGVSISSSLIFFLITNFGVWVSTTFYSKTFMGLYFCYTAGIPFYIGTLFSSIFYSFFLFGLYEYLIRKNIKNLLFNKSFNKQ